MAPPHGDVDRELEIRVEALGFDLVQVVWAGSARRPILRLRIDVPEESGRAARGEGVTVDDCALVSRGLEPWLEGHGGVPERYVLEVSSPGLERPLVRARDWQRFAGEQVAVKGPRVLAGRATRLEGTLVGLMQVEGREVVRLRLGSGEEIDVPREEISGAHIVFRWE